VNVRQTRNQRPDSEGVMQYAVCRQISNPVAAPYAEISGTRLMYGAFAHTPSGQIQAAQSTALNRSSIRAGILVGPS
jgi:ABC-type arginine/histidine transport system permease subunit